MKDMMQKFALVGVICLGALTGVAATGKSAVFPLDLIVGDRVSAGSEELTYSNLWDGDAEATVTIAQDGAAIFTGLSGEGVKTWSVNRNGRYELTHTTYTNGAPGKVETAVFVVEGKEVPVSGWTVNWDSTDGFVYDGEGKRPGVVVKDGETVLAAGTAYTVHYEGNTNAGMAKAILTGLPPYVGSLTNEFAIAKRPVALTSDTKTDFTYDGQPHEFPVLIKSENWFVQGEGITTSNWATVTAVTEGPVDNTFDYAPLEGTKLSNYDITVVTGKIAVASGGIVNPFDPDDPYEPVSPEVLAKANCITNYDGEGHAIEVASLLNPLVAGCLTEIEYSLDPESEPFVLENQTFTNVVTTSVWYRITSSNFKPFTTNAVLSIQPRSIKKVAVTAITDQTYTGSAIEPATTVSDTRVLSGETEPTNIITAADYNPLCVKTDKWDQNW